MWRPLGVPGYTPFHEDGSISPLYILLWTKNLI